MAISRSQIGSETGVRPVCPHIPRSTLSGVTCLPSTPCEARIKTLNPATALRDHQRLIPHRARIATLPGMDRRQNRDQKGQLNRSGSGRESGKESARETPPDWRLKERTLSAPHPVGRSTYPEPLTRSRIASPGHPGTPRAGTLLGSLSHFTSMFVIRSTSRAHFNRGSAGRYTNFP
jgi:hypothetical protein